MDKQKTIQKLKKNIKKKDDQISLLKLVLTKMRKLKEEKSKKSEDAELVNIEKELL